MNFFKLVNKKHFLSEIRSHIDFSYNEDLKSGDLTSTMIPKNSNGSASVTCKEEAIFCGKIVVNELIKSKKNFKIKWFVKDGEKINKGQIICLISGKLNEILSTERLILNYLQILSATSTITNFYVNLIKHTKSKIYDTRKTIPGLRLAQKYAVYIGGGENQRIGLFDKALFKENHISANGNLEILLNKLKKENFKNPYQIEVENIKQLKIALQYQVKNILLDNFTVSQVKQAVAINSHKATLEVSGNITPKNILKYASLGELRISIGALTKNIQAIDFSMLINSKNAHNT